MNTPDTEWEKIAEGFESFQSFFAGLEPQKEKRCIEEYEKYIINYIKQALTSRDTYWKERVRKEVEGILDFIGHWKTTNDECSQEVDRLYLAIKEITRDNKNGLFE